MDTFIHSLENNFSKLTVHKKTTDKNINESLLLPMNTDKITSLNLSNCNLTELPEWFTFNNLTEVDFSFNQFQNVPDLIYTNKKIHTLNLSNNKLANFDVKPKCCSFLLELNLSNNCLENIPSWICSINCDDLRTLKLSNNPFEYQHQLLGRYLKNLKTLELNNSNIRLNDRKNRFLIEIPKLEQLHLSNSLLDKNINFIKELCFEHFVFVPFLKELHLTGLGISTIPEDFAILESLEILNLHKNYISWFPFNFTRLINLKILIVSQNDLFSLPRDINKLKNLEKLFISNNSVGSLPESITELEHLETIDCYNNDFTENIMETIKCISSLVAFDCEQNPFEIQDETYRKKRDALRKENGFVFRLNGPKKSDLIDENNDQDSEDSMSNYSEKSCHEYWEEIEPENWDTLSENSISDDMDLILPKFSVFYTTKPKFSNTWKFVDPAYFEDVSE